jgi:predicted Zn-dependent protease
MTPAQAFTCIDQVLANQKLTLTPPEFAQFLKAMETLHDYENGVVSFVRMPRNSTTKEILDSHAERITRKFWPFMTQGHPDYNQSIANAMQSMLDVLPLIQNNDSMTDH